METPLNQLITDKPKLVNVSIGHAEAALLSKPIENKFKFKTDMGGGGSDPQQDQTDLGNPKNQNKTAARPVQPKGDKYVNMLSKTDDIDEQKLENEVKNNIVSDQVLGNNQFIQLCSSVMQGDFKSFKELTPAKKVEFAYKLMQSNNDDAGSILNTILPFLPVSQVTTALNVCPVKFLNNDKKAMFMKRLASENTPSADNALIKLMITSDPDILALLSTETLMQLRKKEQLGDSFYGALMRNSGNGQVSKADFKKLSQFSARIATICYTANCEAVTTFLQQARLSDKLLSQKDFGAIKGLTMSEQKTLMDKLKKKKLITDIGEVDPVQTQDKIMDDISSIMAEVMRFQADILQQL